MNPGFRSTGLETFTIEPLGSYSLEESAGFIDAWHHPPAEGGATEGHLHLAFLTDDDWAPVGVCLKQDSAGSLVGTVYGAADATVVRRQVERILSLDVDGRGWPEVARRDPLVAKLQKMFPGFRPVNWSNAYEAAAWCLISSRISMRQGQGVKERMSRELGQDIDVHGHHLWTFPGPVLLGAIQTAYGLPSEPDIAKLEELAEAWKPYRMWVCVNLRRTLAGGAGMTHSRAAG